MEDPLGAFVPTSEVRLDGAMSGPLAGIAFAAKDIFDVAGFVTGCGNPDWARTHQPAGQTAPSVTAFLEAGATLVGKTITDELAFSLNGQNFHYGTPTNSNAPGRITGGSSCGSASAVAGGAVELALGSDTGGSVRIPAAYCGLYGLRPSHGRLSLAGVMPLAPSFDTVGWFTRDAALLRRAGEVLFGESASGAPEPSRWLLAEDAFALAEAPIRAALKPFVERLGARLGAAEPLVLGEPGGGLGDWMLHFRHLQAHEIWQTHGAWISETKPTFGPEIAERFAWVPSISDETAAEAGEARKGFSARLRGHLTPGSILCIPTSPGIAPQVQASAESLREHRDRVLSLTCIAGLAGLPQVTLPFAQHAGCPVGLSLVGWPGGDLPLLRFAESFAAQIEAEPIAS